MGLEGMLGQPPALPVARKVPRVLCSALQPRVHVYTSRPRSPHRSRPMATSTIDMACVHPEVSKNTEMPQKSHLSHEMPRPLRVPATLGPN